LTLVATNPDVQSGGESFAEQTALTELLGHHLKVKALLSSWATAVTATSVRSPSRLVWAAALCTTTLGISER